LCPTEAADFQSLRVDYTADDSLKENSMHEPRAYEVKDFDAMDDETRHHFLAAMTPRQLIDLIRTGVEIKTVESWQAIAIHLASKWKAEMHATGNR
jgi:hypothetical protein